MEISLDYKDNLYIFQCPNCNDFVQVERGAVACSIFRHLYHFIIENGKIELTAQVDPHASQEMCERLLKEGKVFGCGKPFKLNHIKNDENGVPVYLAQICEYI